MEEQRPVTDVVTSRRARVALVAGAVAGICGVALLVGAFTPVGQRDLGRPLFALMSIASIVAVVAGIAGLWAERGQRRYALAGLALTLPALVIYGFIAVFIILLLTGEISLD